MHYNKRARNYPNVLIFPDGEDRLKISYMGKMKKKCEELRIRTLQPWKQKYICD